MPFPLLAILPALISAAGSIGGAALARGQNKRSIADQNEYNTPANQLARLREAGLPYSAFEGNQAGNQSTPAASAEGLTEGSRHIANVYGTMIQKKQLETMDAQIKEIGARAVLAEQQAQGVAIDNQAKTQDPYAAEPVSYLARKQRLELDLGEIDKNIKSNRYEIDKIDYEIKKATSQEEIDIIRNRLTSLVNSIKLQDQQINVGAVVDTLIKKIMEDGLSTGEAIMHVMTMGLLQRGVSQPSGSYRIE